MYQARSLIGSDASGLSDPYAQIIFGEYSTKTQVLGIYLNRDTKFDQTSPVVC